MSEVLELTVEETQRLVDACIAAKDNAHAPYSKFRVGAALLTQSGTLYTGTWSNNLLLLYIYESN